MLRAFKNEPEPRRNNKTRTRRFHGFPVGVMARGITTCVFTEIRSCALAALSRCTLYLCWVLVVSMANSRFQYVKKFELSDALLPDTYLVTRLDGHRFTNFTAQHGFTKPNDERGLLLMAEVSFTCVSACLPSIPGICMPVCLFVCLYVYLTVWLYGCLSVFWTAQMYMRTRRRSYYGGP